VPGTWNRQTPPSSRYLQIHFLKTLPNQRDQSLLTPAEPFSLVASPSLQITPTAGFVSRSTVD
jgi:hypothetical protein